VLSAFRYTTKDETAPPAPRPTSFPVLMVANIVDIGHWGGVATDGRGRARD
jgi:hypothetical protein